LNAQIEAGVNVVMIFDTWAGAFSGVVQGVLTRIIQEVCLNSSAAQVRRGSRSSSSPRRGAVARADRRKRMRLRRLDWSIDLGDARRRIGAGAALQGNLDPAVLLTSPEVVRREVRRRSSPSGVEPVTYSISVMEFHIHASGKRGLPWSPQCTN